MLGRVSTPATAGSGGRRAGTPNDRALAVLTGTDRAWERDRGASSAERVAPVSPTSTRRRSAPAVSPYGAQMDPSRQRRRLLLALFATAVSTQSPSPLLLRYADVLDLGALTLTLFFAAYAAGLVPSLLLAGPLSDRDGRRRVVVGGVLAALVCTLVLVAADVGGVPFLVVGRIAQGLASGAVFTVGTVWLRELSASDDAARSRPGPAAPPRWPAR